MGTKRVEPNLVDSVCEALADPEDGRDKGRAALAEKADVSPSTVQKWIDGTRNCTGPAAMIVQQLADHHDVQEPA